MPTEAPESEALEQTSGTPTSPATSENGAPAAEPNADNGSQTGSPETDYKQRYEDVRPEYDRTRSVLADIEGRNGPEVQARALQQYAHIELDEENEEPELEDEFDLRDPIEEIDKVRQELAERDEAARSAEEDRLEEQYCDSQIGALEDSENFKLSDEEYDFVVNRALANRDPHDGKPDIEGSFKAFKQSILSRNKGIFDSNSESVTPPVGTEGERKIDYRDKDALQKLGTEVFEQHRRSQEN